MRVALVIMPFAASNRPSIAAGILKSLLLERRIQCDCKYFNLTFCNLFGQEQYRTLSDLSSINVLAGEWIFSQVYFGESFSSWEHYEREVLAHERWGVSQKYRQVVREARLIAPTFLRIAYEACDWSRFDLVGFTSVFEQTMPSLCLAKMIRQNHPSVKIIMGGSNFEGSMGRYYLDLFPEIDFVSTGEAEISFPELCENLERGIASVPRGILYRQAGEVREGDGRIGHPSLDSLPVPNYDDFFSSLKSTLPDITAVAVPLEASRGCWWGQKRHCTFCGLNGENMAFRRKSWQRVAFEASSLKARYQPAYLTFTDNILAMEYFKTLLPYWAENNNDTKKFFEIKANLRRDQVVMLKHAGIVDVQAGIESFSDRTLQLMDKGICAAQNIALLRWCQELGITAYWNLIFGFPSESLEDYPYHHALLQKITHLRAPEACAPIRMDRFSPNFEKWEQRGFTEMRPLPAYRHIYPLDEDRLSQIAYFFDYQHGHSDDLIRIARDLISFSMVWRDKNKQAKNGTFSVKPHLDGGFVLVDSRFNKPKASHRLDSYASLLLRLADAPISEGALLKRALAFCPGTERTLSQTYEFLLEKEALIKIGERVVTIPLLHDALREAPNFCKEVDCE